MKSKHGAKVDLLYQDPYSKAAKYSQVRPSTSKSRANVQASKTEKPPAKPQPHRPL